MGGLKCMVIWYVTAAKCTLGVCIIACLFGASNCCPIHIYMQLLWLHAKTILFIAPFKSRLIGFFCIATNGASVEAGLHDHPDHQKCMHNQTGNYEVFACKYVMDICLLHMCKSLKIVCSGFVCIFGDPAV